MKPRYQFQIEVQEKDSCGKCSKYVFRSSGPSSGPAYEFDSMREAWTAGTLGNMNHYTPPKLEEGKIYEDVNAYGKTTRFRIVSVGASLCKTYGHNLHLTGKCSWCKYGH